MIAGERDEAAWERVMWVRTLLWIGTGLLALNAAAFISNGRVGLGAVDILLAPLAGIAAALMARHDDRGWWLALAVLAITVALAVVMTITSWAISYLIGSWLPIAMIWALREPPPFPALS